MHTGTVRRSATNFTAAFLLTLSLFALWGLGHRLYDTLLPQFTTVFGLRDFELALTRGVYSIAYFVAAIPAALYARRLGYKAAILFGLGSLCIGAFVLYPAAETHAFVYFLFAVTLMACGWIWLEVAANPLAMCFGRDETTVQRLNVAQSFYPLGALAGYFAGQWIVASNLALPTERFAYAVAHPYIVIGMGVLLLAFLFESAKFPSAAIERARGLRSAVGEFRALFSRRLFVFGMVAQFFSVLALGGTWSQNGRFFASAFPGMSEAAIADVLVWSLAVFGAGRIVGSALMYHIEPDRLLAAFACGGLLLVGLAAYTSGPVGAVALLASSFFLSITWPTVLGIAIRGTGPLMKLGTALICMGGALGGLVFQFMSITWTSPSMHLAMVVPAVSYAVVLAFAFAAHAACRPVNAAGPSPLAV